MDELTVIARRLSPCVDAHSVNIKISYNTDSTSDLYEGYCHHFSEWFAIITSLISKYMMAVLSSSLADYILKTKEIECYSNTTILDNGSNFDSWIIDD